MQCRVIRRDAPKRLFVETIRLLKPVQRMLLECCLNPVEDIERMVLLRPGSISYQPYAQGPMYCRAHLHGRNLGARLNAPVWEIRGWNTSVTKSTAGALSG